MKKWMLVLAFIFIMSGCSAISLGLYGKELDEKIQAFESAVNQYSFTMSGMAEVSFNTLKFTEEETITGEYQRDPYYVRYEDKTGNFIQTKIDGELHTYQVNLSPYEDKQFYVEIDQSNDVVGEIEIKTKSLVITKKNNKHYVLKGELENFFSDKDLDRIYDTLVQLYPTKKGDYRIHPTMDIRFSDTEMRYELTFEFTFENKTLHYRFESLLTQTTIDVLDVNDTNRFFPLPSIDFPVMIDALSPIYHKGYISKNGYYKVYLEPGNYYIESSKPLGNSRIELVSMSLPHNYYPTFLTSSDITNYIGFIQTIPTAGYYYLYVDFAVSDLTIEIKTLDEDRLNLETPELIINTPGTYTFERTTTFDFMTIQLDFPIGSEITLSSPFSIYMIYPSSNPLYYDFNSVDFEGTTLIQTESSMIVYLYASNMPFDYPFDIVVTTP
ncbi:MAG: hypothetical protein RBS87_06865 [Acholeplasma sp.]|jgi:hypothetical protein|nr:hypothetical protein [Acholeplasma sp.]